MTPVDELALATRNVKALAEAANADRVKLLAVMAKVAGLEQTCAQQSQEIQMLKQQLAVFLATRGSGSTVG